MIRHLTSPTNSAFQHLVKLRSNASYRKSCNRILIEGKKLIQDLAKSHFFYTILAKDEELIPEGVESKEILLADETLVRKLCSTETPEGIVAEIELPKEGLLQSLNKLLVLDGISDPGNLGALLRSACAFDWDGVFLLPSCCDPFNDKALRAAKGATFKIPFKKGNWHSLKELLLKEKLVAIAADLKGRRPELFSKKRVALVLGNEGQGLSNEAIQFCTPVTLPISSEMESLNVAVAGGILLYLLKSDYEK